MSRSGKRHGFNSSRVDVVPLSVPRLSTSCCLMLTERWRECTLRSLQRQEAHKRCQSASKLVRRSTANNSVVPVSTAFRGRRGAVIVFYILHALVTHTRFDTSPSPSEKQPPVGTHCPIAHVEKVVRRCRPLACSSQVKTRCSRTRTRFARVTATPHTHTHPSPSPSFVSTRSCRQAQRHPPAIPPPAPLHVAPLVRPAVHSFILSSPSFRYGHVSHRSSRCPQPIETVAEPEHRQ